MRPITTRAGKKIKSRLTKISKDDFINECYNYLALFIKNLKINHSLNILTYKTGKKLNIVYCLASSSEKLSQDDFMVDDDIKNILDNFNDIDTIHIVYNRNLIDTEVREVHHKNLLEKFNQENVKSLISYDINDFIDYIFQFAEDYLIHSIHKSNDKFKFEYQERMSGQHSYIEDIPFKFEEMVQNNPKKFIYENVVKEKKSTAKVWSFVVSEFGFGKTSLLLNLPNLKEGYKYVYIPMSQLGKDVFAHENALATHILENILNKNLNTLNNTFGEVLVSKFRHILHTDKNIILLYDGLDEYNQAYSSKGLQNIFSCGASFNCNCIFTVRKEFLDERRGNFENALQLKMRPKYQYIYLTDWTKKEILTFIDSIENEEIEEFRLLIKDDKYDSKYGDIPKRPLFLKMLVEDILSGTTTIKNIAQLYESYLEKKFVIDRDGSTSNGISERPLSITNEDNYYIIGIIINFLANISSNMIIIDSNRVILNEYIEEEEIRKYIKSEDTELKIIDILLNSVLISFDKRNVSTFKIKFAHKSFQEYFLAYYLVILTLKENTVNISMWLLKYTQGTMIFCANMISNKSFQKKIDDLYINVADNISADSLLYRMATVEAHTKKETLLSYDINNNEFDFFISHSVDDKIGFVDKLVKELESLGLNIFYDSKKIKKTENSVLKINQGFLNLKYGTICIISHNFINSDWCNTELSIAYNLYITNKNTILVLCLDISENEMKEKYPILSPFQPLKTKNISIASIAQEINETTNQAISIK